MNDRSLRLAATALAAVLILSGCAENGAQESVAPSSLDPESGLLVTGLVISDELFPVDGATLTLVGLASTTTDEVGRFAFEGVPEGPYELNVTADGYRAHSMELDVGAGLEELRIVLIGIPGQAPYVRTFIYEGFAVCSWSYVYGAGPFPPGACPLGTPKGRHIVEVGPDWRAGVHEAAWATQDQFAMSSSQSASCRPPQGAVPGDDCPGITAGRSPLKLIARPEDAEYAKQYAVDGKQTWPNGNYTSYHGASYVGLLRTEINQTFNPVCVQINKAAGLPERLGCPFGVGYATGIRFTLYHTTFYLEEPQRLEAFTALPDG